MQGNSYNTHHATEHTVEFIKKMTNNRKFVILLKLRTKDFTSNCIANYKLTILLIQQNKCELIPPWLHQLLLITVADSGWDNFTSEHWCHTSLFPKICLSFIYFYVNQWYSLTPLNLYSLSLNSHSPIKRDFPSIAKVNSYQNHLASSPPS